MLDECELSENVKKVLLDNIQLKLTQQAVKIRADIEVIIYSFSTASKLAKLKQADFMYGLK